MPPKKPSRTLSPSTREKRQASQAAGSVAKAPRSRSGTLTRTIHQQVKDTITTVAGAPNSGSPQHCLHTNSGCSMPVPVFPLWGMGYHLPISCQHSGGVHGDPLHLGSSIINNGYHCPLQMFQSMLTLNFFIKKWHRIIGSSLQHRPTTHWWPTIIYRHQHSLH